jgi:hypothetical protein
MENNGQPGYMQNEELRNNFNTRNQKFEKKTKEFRKYWSFINNDQKITHKDIINKIKKSIEVACYSEIKLIIWQLKMVNVPESTKSAIDEKIVLLSQMTLLCILKILSNETVEVELR